MISVNPETVRQLIDKGRQIHAKEEVVFPSAGDGDEDWGAQILADHARDPVVEEFRYAIEDLEPDQQVDLVALMWVGRGDFSADEFEAARAEAGDRWTPNTADYLIGTPLMPDYLSEGLEELGLGED